MNIRKKKKKKKWGIFGRKNEEEEEVPMEIGTPYNYKQVCVVFVIRVLSYCPSISAEFSRGFQCQHGSLWGTSSWGEELKRCLWSICDRLFFDAVVCHVGIKWYLSRRSRWKPRSCDEGANWILSHLLFIFLISCLKVLEYQDHLMKGGGAPPPPPAPGMMGLLPLFLFLFFMHTHWSCI